MNLKLIIKYYWPHLKRYKKSSLLVFFSYGLGVVGGGIITPLLYKRIIDIVSTAGNPALVGDALIRTVLFLGLVIFLYNSFYRFGDYALVYSQSHALKDIADDAFQRIVRHSYEFFSNIFTGSLVAKVRRYVRAFEQIYDQFVFAAWMSGLRLIFGFAVLTYFSRVLGMVLLVWLILYIGFTALFVKKKFRKDLLETKANSRTTGVLADVITNVLNVKVFTSQGVFLFSQRNQRGRKTAPGRLEFPKPPVCVPGLFYRPLRICRNVCRHLPMASGRGFSRHHFPYADIHFHFIRGRLEYREELH